MIRGVLRRLGKKAKPGPRADVMVEGEVTLDGCELLGPIEIGYRSYANNSLLRNVTIGRFCSIGRRCSIGAALHDMACFTTHSVAASASFLRDPPTVIGNDVWIGDNVVIVAGITIGDGAAIGAGAIVTRDVAPYAIVVGVPAKILRMRFSSEQAAALQASAWWRYGDAAINAAGPGASPETLLHAINEKKLEPMIAAFRGWVP